MQLLSFKMDTEIIRKAKLNVTCETSQEQGFIGWWLPANKIAPMHYENPEEKNREETEYFDCYSHFYIHEEMLRDRVRTLTFMNAI